MPDYNPTVSELLRNIIHSLLACARVWPDLDDAWYLALVAVYVAVHAPEDPAHIPEAVLWNWIKSTQEPIQ